MKRTDFTRIALSLALLAFSVFGLGAQETAKRYFSRVSERYVSIEDYTAELTITRGQGEDAVQQKAQVWYKSPNLLRLEFSNPQDMEMVVDGELLQVWIPELKVAFSQPLRKGSQGNLASVASAGGLTMIDKYYDVSYDPVPDLVPLQTGSSEQVVKMKAEWKSTTEGFRRLELSIDQDLLIRRVTGYTTTNEVITFDFENTELNRGIPDARFVFADHPDGNVIENFLFDPED